MPKLSYIEFVLQEKLPGRLTDCWLVRPKDNPDCVLGNVRWYGAWRCYVYFPVEYTLYEKKCLRDIADFCEAETAKRKW